MQLMAKLLALKVGDTLVADGGFTCLSDGQVVTVKSDDGELFVECADGHHYLDGQLHDDGESLVGLALSKQP